MAMTKETVTHAVIPGLPNMMWHMIGTKQQIMEQIVGAKRSNADWSEFSTAGINNVRYFVTIHRDHVTNILLMDEHEMDVYDSDEEVPKRKAVASNEHVHFLD